MSIIDPSRTGSLFPLRRPGVWADLHYRWLAAGGRNTGNKPPGSGAGNAAGPATIDLDAALLRPADVFASPAQVVAQPLLDREQKREILNRWAWDARLIEAAVAEGAPDGPPSRLDEVLDALRLLDREDRSPETPSSGPFTPDMGARPATPLDTEAVGLAAAA